MSDVLFRSGSFELLPGARERLAKVSGIVLAYQGLHLAVEGHTDSIGTDEYNRLLSERRAGAVREERELLRGIQRRRSDCDRADAFRPIPARDHPGETHGHGHQWRWRGLHGAGGRFGPDTAADCLPGRSRRHQCA